MATAESKFVETLAEKLGLDETSIQKCKEYLRVYQNKISSLRLNIADVAKAVICLDLASKTTGAAFDKQVALQLSGLKRSVYSRHLNTVEKVLDLDKPLTISEVCVQLSCTELKEISENILEKYQDNFPHADLSHPQYVALAIWSASKMKSVKISKQKMILVSRLKPSQWKELEQNFDEFLADTKIGNVSEKNVKKKDKNMMEYIENYAKNKENEGSSSKYNKNENTEDEEGYEVWKARILKEAHEKLQKLDS